jgi:1,2-phenylacetyl-CoA epoxidase catalytic subunit
MDAEQLVKAIREEFYAAINRKTGWGKEELKHEFERSVANALARCVTITEAPKEPKEDGYTRGEYDAHSAPWKRRS